MQPIAEFVKECDRAGVKLWLLKGHPLRYEFPPGTQQYRAELIRRQPEIEELFISENRVEPPEDVFPEPGPIFERMSNIQPRMVSWLWPMRIPLGRITVISGVPGAGKSFVTCDMAARITTGREWPDGGECKPGDVVFICGEDDAQDTIRPRLDAHGADCGRVLVDRGYRMEDGSVRMLSLRDVDEIEARIVESTTDCKLIVIDPIGSYLGSKCDSYKDNEVRSVLAPLCVLAERVGAAVVLVAHKRKSAGGSADDTVLGSRAFTGIARAVWHISKDLEDKTVRKFLTGKSNLGPEMTGLAFRIEGSPARIEWDPNPIELHADDAMREQAQGHKPGPAPEARDDATDWLRDALTQGPRLASELSDEWVSGWCGSERTLRRAKERLKVHTFRHKVPGPWWWSLEPVSQGGQDPCLLEPGHLGHVGKNTGNLPFPEPQESQGGQDGQDRNSLEEPGHVGPEPGGIPSDGGYDVDGCGVDLAGNWEDA